MTRDQHRQAVRARQDTFDYDKWVAEHNKKKQAGLSAGGNPLATVSTGGSYKRPNPIADEPNWDTGGRKSFTWPTEPSRLLLYGGIALALLFVFKKKRKK